MTSDKISKPQELKNPIIDEFLNYLLTIKGYSERSAKAYEYDLIIFFRFIKRYFAMVPQSLDFDQIPINDVSIDELRPINLGILYAFCPLSARNVIIPIMPGVARFLLCVHSLITCVTNKNTFPPTQ